MDSSALAIAMQTFLERMSNAGKFMACYQVSWLNRSLDNFKKINGSQLVMKSPLRIRMTLLHTWLGVIFSFVLFLIFWAGSLSVFDKEIDMWMMPDTRIEYSNSSHISIDRDIIPVLKSLASDASVWTIILPNDRVPYISLSYGSENERKGHRIWLHPHTFEEIPRLDTKGATGFIYPLHHNLTIQFKHIGTWVVGIASMGMLCLLISGIIIHRKIFVDFFTLRLLRNFGRSNLDVHNLTGIALTPFYIIITFSGLVIAFLTYFPNAYLPLYAATRSQANLAEGSLNSQNRHSAERIFLIETLGRERLNASNQKGMISSIDEMVSDAEETWGKGSVYFIRVNYPFDTKSNIMLRRHSQSTVTKNNDFIRYSASSGSRISKFEAPSITKVWNFIVGMHYLKFDHWGIKWLYFLAGLAGSCMIATGLIFWVNARRQKALRAGNKHVSLMDAMTVTAVCGSVGATIGFMVANKLIPTTFNMLNISRDNWESLVFYGILILSLLHAVSCTLRCSVQGHLVAWRQQTLIIALLAITAVVLNRLMPYFDLSESIKYYHLAIVYIDLGLIILAIITTYASKSIMKRVTQLNL